MSTGALLLRPGRGEIEPSLSFARRELDTPVVYTQGAQQLLAAQKLRRNVFDPTSPCAWACPGTRKSNSDCPIVCLVCATFA